MGSPAISNNDIARPLFEFQVVIFPSFLAKKMYLRAHPNIRVLFQGRILTQGSKDLPNMVKLNL